MSDLQSALAQMREALEQEQIGDVYMPLRGALTALEPHQMIYAALYPCFLYCGTFVGYQRDQKWVLQFLAACLSAVQNHTPLPDDVPFDSRLFFEPFAIPFHRTYLSVLARLRGLFQSQHEKSKSDFVTASHRIIWDGMTIWEEEFWAHQNLQEWEAILDSAFQHKRSDPYFYKRHLLPVYTVRQHWLGLVGWLESLGSLDPLQTTHLPDPTEPLTDEQLEAGKIYRRAAARLDPYVIFGDLEQFTEHYHVRYAAPFDAAVSRLFIDYLGIRSAISFVLRLIESSWVWFKAVNLYVAWPGEQLTDLADAIRTLQPAKMSLDSGFNTLSTDDGSSDLVASIQYIARAVASYDKPNHAMSLTLLALHKWISATLKQGWLYEHGTPLTWDARMSRNGTWLETGLYIRVIADIDRLIRPKRDPMR